jgi:hypothetical protein
MSNPISKYPKPPFPGQEQPWPGLASKMEPRPDHGETSYKGSGRLTGRKALITGGDSGMGRGAAIAYAREGADVAINYYPTEEPDAREVVELIEKAGRKAVALPGDLRDRSFCQKLVEDAVNQLGRRSDLTSCRYALSGRYACVEHRSREARGGDGSDRLRTQARLGGVRYSWRNGDCTIVFLARSLRRRWN